MRRTTYLILAVAGFVIPYYYFVSFLLAQGLDFRAFFQQLFATQIATFFAADLLISSVVFLAYLRRESARHHVGNPWLYVVVLFTVGLSCAWPLFLYVRESRAAPAPPAVSA